MNDNAPNHQIYDHTETFNHRKPEMPIQTPPYEDLECLIKKRRMNDGSFQSTATTSSPKNSVGRDLSFGPGLDNGFPVIQEIEESQTQTYTGSTPSRNQSPAMSHSSHNLKRRLMTDLPDLTNSIVVNQKNDNFRSIEHDFENMYRRRFTESPRMASHAQAREMDFIKPEGKLSKLQAKLKSKEGSHTVGKDMRLFEIQEYDNPRDSDDVQNTRRRFDLSSPKRDSSIPIKKKVNLHPNRPGSQSVSKFSSNNLAFPWLNSKPHQNNHDAENHLFKARPMPRYVPFEAKKSDRKCIIPQDFVLHTEQRIMERQQHSRRQEKSPEISMFNDPRCARSFIKEEPAGANSHFKAKAMPTFNHVFKPKTGEAILTETVEFNLNTKNRAERRTQFDLFMKEKERMNEIKRKMQEEENRRKEQEEIAELRRKLVFKARPYRNHSPAVRDPNRFPVHSYQSPRKESMNTSIDQA